MADNHKSHVADNHQQIIRIGHTNQWHIWCFDRHHMSNKPVQSFCWCIPCHVFGSNSIAITHHSCFPSDNNFYDFEMHECICLSVLCEAEQILSSWFWKISTIKPYLVSFDGAYLPENTCWCWSIWTNSPMSLHLMLNLITPFQTCSCQLLDEDNDEGIHLNLSCLTMYNCSS